LVPHRESSISPLSHKEIPSNSFSSRSHPNLAHPPPRFLFQTRDLLPIHHHLPLVAPQICPSWLWGPRAARLLGGRTSWGAQVPPLAPTVKEADSIDWRLRDPILSSLCATFCRGPFLNGVVYRGNMPRQSRGRLSWGGASQLVPGLVSLDVCSIEYKKGSARLCFHQSLLQTPPSAGPRSVATGLEKHRASWTHAEGRPSHRLPKCRINRAMTSPRYSSPGFLDAKLTLSGHPKVIPSQETDICRTDHSRRMLGVILGLEYASERAIPFA
jgi:hypothetical protein